MTDTSISSIKNKLFANSELFEKNKRPSAVEQILIEIKWIDKLQRELEYGNNYVLKSFTLRLVIDEEDDNI